MPGTITLSKHIQPKRNGILGSMRFAWTSDTGGAVSGTTWPFNGRIERLVTNPGAAAPTDNYDVTIEDEDGVDVLGGVGANRDTVNSEQAVPVLGTYFHPAHAGTIEPKVAAAGSAKTGEIIIYYSR